MEYLDLYVRIGSACFIGSLAGCVVGNLFADWWKHRHEH